ncbi:dephospho-CoA kinase [Acinetobacter qingfengensis]|uniref:Dephospho-CoA kinase n=1 Tax=Acinetobacter qingfengensis TaxID=1262585 RepID=A0A1E7RDQ3_9GAMM|nr:dephospho-CoA kinase [Acinetobacter qingfengensis]KAA8733700.1 dephospho-CoA kinase [Acinetobacter qingfengensis]OEY97484.1 dephospho-CoA kinase [Acinetobacter qingfengensis]
MHLIIGLAGGIGSGKTAASQWFEQQGITVVDADIVAREVVQPDSLALQRICHAFGEWVLLDDGQLNRKALREYIFNHPEARQQLEEITHPIIRQEILRQLQMAQSPYVILVSPLLFETKQHHLVQRTLLIDVPESLQLQRATQRDVQSTEQIAKIIATQMPRAKKQQLADDIVINDGHLEHLYQQLQPLHTYYLSLAKVNRT